MSANTPHSGPASGNLSDKRSGGLIQRLLGSSLSIAATYIYHLLPATAALGVDNAALLRQAGLSESRLAQSDLRLPLWQVLKLLQHLEQHFPQPALGIQLGSQVRPKSFPVLGYAAMSADTMGDAIGQLLRFEQLVWDVGNAELICSDDYCRIRQSTHFPDLVPQTLIEMSMAGWVSIGRELLNDNTRLRQEALPSAVHFRRAAPADTRIYDDFFRCPVVFSQAENALIFPASLMQEPTRDADPQMQQWMQQQGTQLLSHYDQELNLTNEVRAAIYRLLQQGEPELERIAASLNINPRTLRRKLQEMNSGVKELVDEMRQELALLYLQQPRLSLVDIAFMLGFSEQSAFTRAFKRWQGMPPGRYRELQNKTSEC